MCGVHSYPHLLQRAIGSQDLSLSLSISNVILFISFLGKLLVLLLVLKCHFVIRGTDGFRLCMISIKYWEKENHPKELKVTWTACVMTSGGRVGQDGSVLERHVYAAAVLNMLSSWRWEGLSCWQRHTNMETQEFVASLVVRSSYYTQC